MQNHTCSTHLMIRKILICALFLAAAILPAQEAQAVVNATSTTRNIAINRTASVQVRWRGSFTPPPTNNVATSIPYSSPQGALSIPNGPVLLRIQRTVGGLAVLTGRSFIFTVSENVLIPASVIARARAAGANQVAYERSFTPGGRGTVLFNITGSAGAGFSIFREALSFTDK